MEREVGGGIGMGDTCKSMADSFQCMAKALPYCKVIININNVKLSISFLLSYCELGLCHLQQEKHSQYNLSKMYSYYHVHSRAFLTAPVSNQRSYFSASVYQIRRQQIPVSNVTTTHV